MSWALRVWRIERLWSVNTFLKTENEFSHIAVEAPSVNPVFKAVSTLGIASNVLSYFERRFCVVNFAFPSLFICVEINCLATIQSVSTMVDFVKGIVHLKLNFGMF